MFSNFSQSTGNVEKKRLSRNPFKPPTPVKRQGSSGSQQTLSFFANKSSSSTGLSPIESKKKAPLETASSSELNRQGPTTPNFFNLQRSSSSLTTASRAGSFQEDTDDDDVIFLKTESINLKNSKPVGSLLTGLKPKEQRLVPISKSANRSTPPSSAESSSSFNQPNPSSSSFVPKVTLGKLGKSSNGQATLNFGSKDPSAKKRINPWESAPLLSKIKNPRIKDEPTRVIKVQQTSMFLSTEQQEVLNLVVNQKMSVFYTGSAGTGKSVLLRELVKTLHKIHGSSAVAVTASTGLAAVNIGGITINRFSGFGLGLGTKEEIFHRVKRNAENRERWKRTKVLIIDEISMLDGRFLDKLEYVARNIRGKQVPFGGIQVVLTGDFFQLPPVDKKSKDKNIPSPIFCFESACWSACIKRTILLKKVFRQADSEFVNLLNAVRIADVNDEVASQFMKLKRTVEYDDDIQPTELFSTRYEVDSSNKRRLERLPGMTHVFTALDIAPDNLKFLLEGTMASHTLTLKEDAQVMMLKNIDDFLVNGSVGKVLTFLTKATFDKATSKLMRDSDLSDDMRVKEIRMLSRCYRQSSIPQEVLDFAERYCPQKEEFLSIARTVLFETDEPLPIVRFNGKGMPPRFVCVERMEFKVGQEKDDNDNISRTQVPLLLSWALSIHKSQGQTLDRVKVDLTRVFEAGQVYVALSRAVSKDRLQVINFEKQKITTNQKVKQFYQSLESL